MISPLVCARNNADLYDAVFRAHGLPCSRSNGIWSTTATPLPYYSSLLLLAPDSSAELLEKAHEMHERIGRTITFKDGFDIIDGAHEGLSLLFSARWIFYRGLSNARQAPWTRVHTPVQLASWEMAWNATAPTDVRIFPDAILADPDLAVFGLFDQGSVVAGCIANLSADCVDLSNVFGNDYHAATVCAATIASGKPVVGYERGEDLVTATKAGFEVVGNLKVWELN